MSGECKDCGEHTLDCECKDFIFSKDLRKKMSEFENMNCKEALSCPEFFNALFDHAGMSEKEKNDLWDNIGRPDFKL